MAQIGKQNAIDISIEKFEKLVPAISDICQYFISAVDNNEAITWHSIVESII